MTTTIVRPRMIQTSDQAIETWREHYDSMNITWKAGIDSDDLGPACWQAMEAASQHKRIVAEIEEEWRSDYAFRCAVREHKAAHPNLTVRSDVW